MPNGGSDWASRSGRALGTILEADSSREIAAQAPNSQCRGLWVDGSLAAVVCPRRRGMVQQCTSNWPVCVNGVTWS